MIPYKDEYNDCVYPLGFDPSWSLSNDVLVYTNSIKQKLAVTIAACHLFFGLLLGMLNSCYFSNYKKFAFKQVTGCVILFTLFGYMILLIMMKFWYPVNPYIEDGDKDYDKWVDMEPNLSTSP